jgi:hypothetical protein
MDSIVEVDFQHHTYLNFMETRIWRFVLVVRKVSLKTGHNPHSSTSELFLPLALEYLRDFRTRTAKGVHDHVTGRKCVCGGNLYV